VDTAVSLLHTHRAHILNTVKVHTTALQKTVVKILMTPSTALEVVKVEVVAVVLIMVVVGVVKQEEDDSPTRRRVTNYIRTP
jgi:hypothetical protein